MKHNGACLRVKRDKNDELLRSDFVDSFLAVAKAVPNANLGCFAEPKLLTPPLATTRTESRLAPTRDNQVKVASSSNPPPG